MTWEAPETELIGETFGPYAITGCLGRGAFSVVYEAYKMPLRKRVALKVLNDRMLAHPVGFERFQREAETAAQLHHPHIIEVLDVGVHDGRAFLAMEYLEGETLGAFLLREGCLTVETAVDLLLPIVSALCTVHEMGVVHRDIKNENIFLVPHPSGAVHPKLLDFGIAKLTGDGRALTRTGAVLGTPYFMSPEQALESKHIDARADQWSVGVILYGATCGAKPFRGASLYELMQQIIHAVPSPLRVYQPQIPAGFERAVLRALAKNPEERFASMKQFGAALLPFASDDGRRLWERQFGREGVVTVVSSQVPARVRVRTVPRMMPVEDSTLTDAVTAIVPQVRARDPGPVEVFSSSAPPISFSARVPSVSPPAPASPQPLPLQGTTQLPPSGRVSARAKFGAVAILVVATCAAAALLGLARPRGRTAPVPAPAPVSAPVVVSPAPAPARSYRVSVTVEPPHATVVLDNRPVGTGTLARDLDADGRPHSLRFTAEGYETHVLVFSEADPPPAVVTLQRASAPPVADVPAPMERSHLPPPRRGPTTRAPDASTRAPCGHFDPTTHLLIPCF